MPPPKVEQVATLGKDHGRIEVPTHTVSDMVDWYDAQRSYPGAPCFPQLATVAMVDSRIERGDKIETERRSYISSRGALGRSLLPTLCALIEPSKTSCIGFST